MRGIDKTELEVLLVALLAVPATAYYALRAVAAVLSG